MEKEFQVEAVNREYDFVSNEIIFAETAEEAVRTYQEKHPHKIAYTAVDCNEIDENSDFDSEQPIKKEHIAGFFKYLEDDWWYCCRNNIYVVTGLTYPLIKREEAVIPVHCLPIIYKKWGKEFVYGYIDYDRNTKVISQIVVREDCPLSTLLFLLKDIMEDSLIDLDKVEEGSVA